MKTTVRNIESRNGNKVPNQFIISTDDGEIFQSYRTIIAKYESGVLVLDTKAMNYSQTTSKYLYLFTGMDKKELLSGIKSGEIKVTNLN